MKIIFTSDIHCYLFPTTFAERSDRNMGHYRIIGSYEKDDDTLVIDGGDNLQGSALGKFIMEEKIFSPLPQARAFREGGLDIAVPGNHDFNYGRTLLSSFLSQTGARILCANLTDRNGEINIEKHIVVTDRSGLRIGLTGLVTDYVNLWEKKENISSFIISDVREAAEKELEWLKRNSDVSVLIYHGGFECDLESGLRLQEGRENIGYELCRDLDYSLILSGHQHRGIPFRKVCNSYVLQAPSFGLGYGVINITPEGITGTLASPDSNRTELEEKNRKLRERTESWLDEPIGEIGREIAAPSLLSSMLDGNHIADFFNYVQMKTTLSDVSICALNNSLFPFHKRVTIRDILASYQYPNTLCLIEIDESGLRSALENTASFFTVDEEGGVSINRRYLIPKMEMYNYDYYYGIEYEFDLSRPVGERVTRLLFRGEEIGERKLRLCLNNYRITGSGGYSVYPGCRILKSFDTDVQDLSIEYVLSNKDVLPVWPRAMFTTKGYSFRKEGLEKFL